MTAYREDMIAEIKELSQERDRLKALNAELLGACQAAWEYLGTFDSLSLGARKIETLLCAQIAKAKK